MRASKFQFAQSITRDRIDKANVRGTVVDAHFSDRPPAIGAKLQCLSQNHESVVAFVHSHLGRSRVRAIAVESTRGLRRGCRVETDGLPMTIPVGKQLLGRVIDLHGRPLDGGSPLQFETCWPLDRPPPLPSERQARGEAYPTGIKVIDLFCPFTYGGRVAVFGGAGVGKTVVLTEFIHNAVEGYQGWRYSPVHRRRSDFP